MRKPVLGLVTVIAVLAAATILLFMRYQKTSADFATAKAVAENTQQRYVHTLDAIAEIQDSLNAIALGDTSVQWRSPEGGPNPANGQEALDRIAALRSSILHSKRRIEQLESDVKMSGLKVASLQRMIKNLKKDVTAKEEEVASLQTQVTGLATQVQETQDTVRARDVQVEDQRRNLATVYYIVGSKKDLQTSGVVQAKGGVLGLGKTLTAAGTTDQSRFTALDTDVETVVHTDATKARLLSAQPASSYELVLVDGKMELHILNPEEFRKIKQVVILTA